MRITPRQLTIRVLYAFGVITVYGGFYYALMWALTYHPKYVVLIIAIAGIPVVLVALKFYGREEQRRSAWSSVRDFAKGELSSVPVASPDQPVIGIGVLESVLFRAITIYVNENGIRIDRPFRAVRPLVIPWSSVQRVDTYESDERVKQKNQDSALGARLFLSSMEQPIVLFPWNMDFEKHVPDRIGRGDLSVAK